MLGTGKGFLFLILKNTCVQWFRKLCLEQTILWQTHPMEFFILKIIQSYTLRHKNIWYIIQCKTKLNLCVLCLVLVCNNAQGYLFSKAIILFYLCVFYTLLSLDTCAYLWHFLKVTGQCEVFFLQSCSILFPFLFFIFLLILHINHGFPLSPPPSAHLHPPYPETVKCPMWSQWKSGTKSWGRTKSLLPASGLNKASHSSS